MDALVELFWKSSLILAAAGCAALLARRASAATRHLIWTAALLGTLLLPLGMVLLPRLGIAALPPEEAPAMAFPVPPSDAPVSVQPAPVAPASPRPAPVDLPARIDWGHVARLVWASVALALLLRIAAGDLQLRGIARKAQRAVSREWLDLLEECARRLGVRREVVLLESDEVSVPITWGTLSPRIVVPRSADGWTFAHKRAVLLHELAHVERHDALTQRIARLCCAFQWVNPLAWAAAAAMRSERERACDDRVLGQGALPTEYATSLLEVARTAGSAGGAALAMARRRQLEGRLLAVLDPRVDRRPLSRKGMSTALCAAAVVVAPLAAVRAERAVAPVEAARLDVRPSAPMVEPRLPAPAPMVDMRPRAAPKVKLAQTAPAVPPAPPAAPAPPIPPAPSAAPAPPTPPAPPAPSGHGSTHVQDRDSNTWTSTWSDGARSVSVNARGQMRWNQDGTDLIGLSPGGSFDLTIHDGGHHWHAEIVPGPGSLTRTLLVDGAPRPWDAAWFARALEDLDRRTAFAVDSRFPRLYQGGGAPAVLQYVESMDGDYARRQYLQRLVERDPLDDATAVAVFRVLSRFSGDYDRAEVLKAVAAKARLDTDAKRQAFLAACDGIQGDHDRGRVLQELISQPKLSPELTRAVLSAAAKMGGDYDKVQALTGLAQRHPVDPLDYLKAASKVGGDYEHARVLKALLSSQKLTDAAQVEVIRQARHLGDYEAAEVLVALSRSTRLSPDAQREYEAAAEHLGDYSRKRVLAAANR